MASILKVSQLQKPDGSTPTAADLGIDVAGTIVQAVTSEIRSNISTSSNTAVASGLSVAFTPKYSNSKIIVKLEGGRYWCGTAGIQMNFDLYRDGTTATGGMWGAFYSSAQNHVQYNQMWEENAGSTAERTYSFYFWSANSGVTVFLNESSANRIPIFLNVYEIAQ
jgi:hypothetical protein